MSRSIGDSPIATYVRYKQHKGDFYVQFHLDKDAVELRYYRSLAPIYEDMGSIVLEGILMHIEMFLNRNRRKSVSLF